MNQFQPPIQNPSPNHYNSTLSDASFMSEFELSDFLMDFEDGSEVYFSSSQNVVSSDNLSGGSNEVGGASPRNSNKLKKSKQGKLKVAFRTQSEKDVIDDGFKWRKYGKKMVKSSPYARNYYKCSSGGCTVKKRVERESEDPSYVITTYEGKHNHESPSLVYYNETPLMIPDGWTLMQAASTTSHSSSS